MMKRSRSAQQCTVPCLTEAGSSGEYPFCCLLPAVVYKSLFLSLKSFALTLWPLWTMLAFCGGSGTQAGQLWCCVLTREFGSRVAVLTKFALVHSPMLDPYSSGWEQCARMARDIWLGRTQEGGWVRTTGCSWGPYPRLAGWGTPLALTEFALSQG